MDFCELVYVNFASVSRQVARATKSQRTGIHSQEGFEGKDQNNFSFHNFVLQVPEISICGLTVQAALCTYGAEAGDETMHCRKNNHALFQQTCCGEKPDTEA